MQKIKTTEAVGHILCHDITRIIRDEVKDAVFRKGHVVKEEDIPVLLSLGKDNLYIWEQKAGMLHENAAAEVLRDICKNDFMSAAPPKEGKIDLFAEIDGLLTVDGERLCRINALGEMMIATRHGNFPVKEGDKLAGMRVIPLVIEQEKMDRAKALAGNVPLLRLHPFRPKKAALVVTGNEVYHGRIQDAFGPVIADKLAEYGLPAPAKTILSDDPDRIAQTILAHIAGGADLIICTGGMSVDPDDTTPAAIRKTGAQLVTYGAPVLPGAMFLLAYYDNGGQRIPILGLPGCVMYAKRTVFDLVLPRILADVPITQEDISVLGQGGLCLECESCTYPNCGFGKQVT